MSKNPKFFQLTIELGNDAMQTPRDVADLLTRMANYMREYDVWPSDKVRDINGNTVGIISVI